MNILNKNFQRGYTLIELSIGLAVTSLVIAGVLMGVQRLMLELDVGRTIKQVSTAAESIRGVMRRDPDSGQITLQKMTASTVNAFYLSNVSNPGTASATVASALGNNIMLLNSKNVTADKPPLSTTSPSDYAPVDIRHFRIVLENVTPATCADLLGGLEGIAISVYARPQSKGGTSYKTVKDGATSYSAASARSACNADENNALIFEIKIYGA